MRDRVSDVTESKVATAPRTFYPWATARFAPARSTARTSAQAAAPSIQVIRTHLPPPTTLLGAVACKIRCFPRRFTSNWKQLPQILTLNDTFRGHRFSRIVLEPYGKQVKLQIRPEGRTIPMKLINNKNFLTGLIRHFLVHVGRLWDDSFGTMGSHSRNIFRDLSSEDSVFRCRTRTGPMRRCWHICRAKRDFAPRRGASARRTDCS